MLVFDDDDVLPFSPSPGVVRREGKGLSVNGTSTDIHSWEHREFP